MTLTLDQAQTIVAAALQEARRTGLKPLVVTVLDARGAPKALAAEDGTSLRRAEIAIGKANGATINDTMLTVLAGGLRTFLADLGELPDRPLVAFLPVNVRTEDETGSGNVVAAILASMATDVEDPLERLGRIAASTKAAKEQITGLTREAVLAYSSLLMAPSGVQALSALTGIPTLLPFTFNVCVSNVPGPTEPLYLQGSRLEAFYPASIPVHGMALNITMMSYANTMNVGFIGCRDSLPRLQRLAIDTGEAFDALGRAQD